MTGPVRTWLDLGSVLSVRALVAIGDYMVLTPRYPVVGDARPFTTPAELIERAAAFQGRGARTLRAAAERVRERVESNRETDLRLLIVDAGLPEPDTGVTIEIAGSTYVLDLYYRRWRVAPEYDGEQHRLDDQQYERDESRSEAITRSGRTHIRVRKAGLRASGRAQTIARIRRALEDAGWRPGMS